MFTKLGHVVAQRAKFVLAVSALFIVVTAAFGLRVLPVLSSGGYDDPHADSAKAAQYIKERFGVSDPWVIVLIDSGVSVDEPVVTAAAATITTAIEPLTGVESVASYWTFGAPPQLRSRDGKAAYLFVYMADGTLADWNATAAAVGERLAAIELPAGLVIHLTGGGVLMNGVNGQMAKDLRFAEAVAIPLSALLTVLVFRSVIAALTPFVVALLAIPGALCVLWLAHRFTEVSIFGLNLVIGLGLGLGIDYALLIVSRFREELAAGGTNEEAVVRTVETAGRTVLYSGSAVALTLASMAIFPQYFLQTFAWAGVSVVLLAVVGAIVPLPALLSLLGHRVDAGGLGRGSVKASPNGGAWAWVARFVMRRPWPVVIAATAVLAVLTSPVAGLRTGQVDARVLPAGHPVAVAGQVLRDRFQGGESQPLKIVVPGGAKAKDAVARYAVELSRVDHISRVITPDNILAKGAVVAPNPLWGTFVADEDLWLNAIIDVDAYTPDGMAVADAVRALAPPVAGTVVGGAAALYADAQRGVSDNLPWAVLWIVLTTLIVLALFTGSMLLPVKAVIMNIASLAATFGVLTWIFQDGHLAGVFGGFTLTGTLDTSTLVLIAVVVFGLSMDYELFLLSRIKELHDAGEDTETAVALGLQRSGRIITAAALILAAVFASFVTSDVTSMKLLGVGVAFAILLDASLVRGLLVPALMRIAGRWNWWAPRWLTVVHARLALKG